MTKANPNNKYPKKTQAAAIATKAMAAKNHRKFIMSARYLMKHMPEPVVTYRSANANSHQWVKQVGLTVGRTLSALDVQDLTMRMIVNANQMRTDLQASCQTFLKAVKPYLPPSLMISCDWSNFRKRSCSDPKVAEVADELEDFAADYFKKIESQLACLYLNVGDRNGAQYLKVLERRFRENWNVNAGMYSKVEVKTEKEAEGKEKEANVVTFEFTTVESHREAPNG